MIWIGIAAGLVVLVLMAVSDHMNDHAQAEDIAPATVPVLAERTKTAAASAVLPTRSTHLPTAA
ncbi:hypothetical protein [Allokutzneria multivorans]